MEIELTCNQCKGIFRMTNLNTTQVRTIVDLKTPLLCDRCDKNQMCCDGWNPWHHPFTYHAGWCSQYKHESELNKAKNIKYQDAGGYYHCDQELEIWKEALEALERKYLPMEKDHG